MDLYFESEKDIKIENLTLYNCSNIHNYHYNYKLHSPVKFNNVEIKEETLEIIDYENFKFCTLKNDTCVSDSLRQNKLFEKFLLSYISTFIPKNKNMMDIGSNIGIYSIIYNYILDKNTKIYAFEPQEKIYNCIVNNITLNNCDKIIAYNYGLSDKNEVKYMNANYDTKDNFGAFRIVDNEDISNKLLKIETKIGDELNLTNIGFIKIDVEGYELEVLNGLKNTISRDMPYILIEIHQSSKNCNRTIKYIYDFGYRKYLRLSHCDFLFFKN